MSLSPSNPPPKPLSSQLIASSRAVAARAATDRAAAVNRPPASGQLYVFSTRAGDEEVGNVLEWVWVATYRDGRSERCLLLPVDTFHLAGSADLAVGDGSSRMIRCQYRAEVSPETLGTGLLTGAIDAEIARAAAKMSEAWRAGNVELDGEIDFESDYRHWIKETVDKELAALRASTDGTAASGEVLPMPSLGKSSRRPTERWVRLAASLLLVSTAAFGWLWTRGGDESLQDGVAVNLPLVWLGPEELLRGAEESSINLDGAVGPVVFVLMVEDASYGGRYVAELYREDEPESLWTGRDLIPSGVNEVTLAIPPDWLTAGVYRLILTDQPDDAAAPQRDVRVVGTYRLLVEGKTAAAQVVP